MVFSLHSTGFIKLNRFVLIYALCACVMSTPASSTEVYAGLSATQLNRSTQLVDQLPWREDKRKSDKNHPLGVQTLSIELAERKKGSQARQINVFQHNYATQSSRLVRIDVDSDKVVMQQTVNSVHLPLNDAEIAYASRLVEQNARLMGLINAEQQNRGLMPLLDLDSLDVKASVFEPLDAAHVCHTERCALLSLFDKTSTVYVTEPVVNLLRGTVQSLSDAQ